jgi:hypothetical protein
MKLYMFRTVRLSIISSLLTVHSAMYMSYRIVDSFRAGPGWNSNSILVLLESCVYSACITYNIAECTVNELLMMDRRSL